MTSESFINNTKKNVVHTSVRAPLERTVKKNNNNNNKNRSERASQLNPSHLSSRDSSVRFVSTGVDVERSNHRKTVWNQKTYLIKRRFFFCLTPVIRACFTACALRFPAAKTHSERFSIATFSLSFSLLVCHSPSFAWKQQTQRISINSDAHSAFVQITLV